MAELVNARTALDTSGTVWKSSSELGLDNFASMAWGARNLISTQVRNGRGHHLRAPVLVASAAG